MKCSKQEEIRDTVDFACRLKPEDLVWKPIYPNNILSNGIEGCYALVLRKDPDGRIYGRKYSILFQKEEDPEHLGEGILALHARTELYILLEKGYYDVSGPLDYPEPAEGGHSPFSQSEQENTFHSCGVNDYGRFVRAYPTLELAKKRAAAQFRAVFGYAMSCLLPDEEQAPHG